MKRLLSIALFFVFTGAVLEVLYAQHGSLAVPPDKAILVIRLPAQATLSIGDHATVQRGTERTFLTPSLVIGTRYSYSVEARWLENGQQKMVTRRVEFQPGQATEVDLTRAEAPPVVAEKKLDVKKEEPPPLKFGEPKTRTFLFTYGGKVKDLPAGKEVKVWLPFAESNASQDVTVERDDLPGTKQIAKEKQYGNSILFFEAKANDKGEVPFQVTYRVKRREVLTDVKRDVTLKPAGDEKLERFRQPDAKVPLSGKPLDLLKENLGGRPLPEDPFAAAKFMYDLVNKHMTYKKVGTGWGQGDALWACDSKYGNCTDFHSLFISMARGNKIASKFEMGFPIPEKHGMGNIGGYHCWAWFLPEAKGWIPVDISEANRNPALSEYYFGNLTEDRVSFSTGRDINLVPQQKGSPLNFFIYPYVEVDGQPLPNERIDRMYTYQDVK